MNDAIHVTRDGVYHTSAGGIVVYTNDTSPVVALLQWKEKNRWTFPKGHVKTSETAQEAARREVCEELGIAHCPLPIKKIGTEHSVFTLPKDTRVHSKQTHLYLFVLNKKYRLTPNKAEHFIRARWVALDRAELLIKPSPFVKNSYVQIGKRIIKKISLNIY